MPCYKPLDAFEITHKAEQKSNGKKSIAFNRPQHTTYTEIQLPCGQCIGCRLLRSVTWASRIMHELQEPPKDNDGNNKIEPDIGCFITLTYNDTHLPKDHSLVKKHFQDFIKRLRRAIHPIKIRYFMCGEYGDDSWRPHYHAIIFGYDFSQSVTYKFKGDKEETFCPGRKRTQLLEVSNPYYISPLLSKLWKYGYHIVADCTWDSAAYVARYCTKKVNGEKADQHYNRLVIDWNEHTGEIYQFTETDLQPEYATMSRRPGIGQGWYEKYKDDCYPSNYLIKDGHKTPIPKYYDRLLEKEDEIQFRAMKMARELALLNAQDELTRERLEQRHYTKKQQYKTLRRNKI